MKQGAEYFPLLERQMQRVISSDSLGIRELEQTFLLFSMMYEHLTQSETIGFTTLFSRIAFSGVRFDLPSRLIFENHYFRRAFEKKSFKEEEIVPFIKLGMYLIQAVIRHISDHDWRSEYERPQLKIGEIRKVRSAYKRIFRALLIDIDEKSNLHLIDEEKADVIYRCRITSDSFAKQIQNLTKYIDLPVSINLIDVNFVNDEECTAAGVVLRPDFLFGVTSVSECFSADGTTALNYFGRKLIPSDGTVHMLVGNIVNQYLDELIHNPDLEFKEVMQSTFKIGPEMFSLMNDNKVKETINKVKRHFHNLKKVVKTELAEAGITKEKTYLEPSFYSNEFGLQGRLDLYHFDEETSKSDIVELKSGKVYKAHAYGLNQNHYVQTLLYDLLIESVYDNKVKSTIYILYSGDDQKRLRFAAKVRQKQMDAMRLRNSIVILEEVMTKLDQLAYKSFLDKLNPDRISEKYRFLRRDAKLFWEYYSRLTELEQNYYRSFVAFISREFQLSKIGRHGIHRSNGLASLWLDPIIEKQDRFSILSLMKIIKNETNQEVPLLTLAFSKNSSRLSKFRVGEVTVLYPENDEGPSPLSNQIFKCTILEIDTEKVVVRLRARQKNFDLFRKYDFWNLESDVLDSGFNHQFYGLFDFMSADAAHRRRMLCLDPPSSPDEEIDYENPTMTDEQIEVMRKAIAAKDYYLLWGPPGTGKTSVMIRNLVEYYHKHTSMDILLLAYTNKAVDEICASIHDILECQYLRIGSRHSTGQKYIGQLLSTKTERIQKRLELIDLFDQTRITVSTVSSFQGKRELKKLKKFDVVIVDEASQLLEPMLVGILSRFDKSILIGDHKQLPAVVTQRKSQSRVEEVDLRKVGLHDRRISLFERMYHIAVQKEWHWAYGALSYQGRMHQDILSFISPEFYENSLKVLPQVDRLVQTPTYKAKSKRQEFLIENRMIFIDAPKDPTLTRKTNQMEAKLVAKLVSEWEDIYKNSSEEITLESIGVITPFRSQIATIKAEAYFKKPNKITIDTVERYQGGSRNQIIISLAVNEYSLLKSITNVSDEGIDRKLNVALTRAKENIVIIGNKEILSKNSTYQRLINYCKCLEMEKFYELNVGS